MAKDSLVLELQRLAQSSATDIGELLRKAKVVAVKLGLAESARWLDREANGYSAGHDLPAYRVVPCQLNAHNPFHGWRPVVWEGVDPVSEHFSTASFRHSLSQIQHLVANSKGSVLRGGLSPAETVLLAELSREFAETWVAKFIQPADVAAILDAVRNRILDWALQLEQQGVLGEGVSFSENEKRGQPR